MFRRLMRRGIRAVRAGNDPAGVFRDAGAVIPTFCNNTVMHMPAAATELAIAQSRYLLRPRLSGAAAISAWPRIAPRSADQASGGATS